MARLRKPRRNRLSPAELWRREEASVRRRRWEQLINLHIRAWGLPKPELEFRFHESRAWRFDLAWPEFRVAVEIEGVLWSGPGGRHQRPIGLAMDAEKYNAAQLRGWVVLRFTPTQIKSGAAVREIETALEHAAFLGGTRDRLERRADE